MISSFIRPYHPHPINFLSFICLEMLFRRTCSRMEVRLVSLQFPESFLLHSKTGVNFAFFQSLGTSHNHHDLSKVIENDLAMTSNITSSCEWNLSDPRNLCLFRLFKCSLHDPCPPRVSFRLFYWSLGPGISKGLSYQQRCRWKRQWIPLLHTVSPASSLLSAARSCCCGMQVHIPYSPLPYSTPGGL